MALIELIPLTCLNLFRPDKTELILLTGKSCKTTHEKNTGPSTEIISRTFLDPRFGISLTKANIILVEPPSKY